MCGIVKLNLLLCDIYVGKYKFFIQGMVDSSASRPALRQDTGYMVEKTFYDIAQYLGASGAFGAYLMPQ